MESKKKTYKIGILGAGGWGTALSITLTDNNHKVRLWTFEDYVADEINNQHTNSIFLNGVSIPESVTATTKFSDLKNSDLFVIAIPTQYIRSVLKSKAIPKFGDKIVVSVAKGIEKDTLMLVSEIVTNTVKLASEQFVIMSGPSHAEEVARKLPTTVVAASENITNAKEVQSIFMTPYFRIYTTDDVIGCEIGGSLKNVIAIAAGIIDGLGLGDNTKAALITRGLAEITRLGVAIGANTITFSGLSGLGDLFVTCNSKLSRNRFVGEQIGLGKNLKDIQKSMEMVAEGIQTTESAYFLAKKHIVEVPIIEQMYQILFKGKKPAKAIEDLMTRQSKREWWW
ncbi:MAG: NAD(P)H-dependent glycerol-3-phosphate dehydrogenase [Bacteroidetes bacterium]|nr:MAG: NAD(P)H-dependent glycerol-3-phosphate dehydrogenase [Bacteroidota bacterium]